MCTTSGYSRSFIIARRETLPILSSALRPAPYIQKGYLQSLSLFLALLLFLAMFETRLGIIEKTQLHLLKRQRYQLNSLLYFHHLRQLSNNKTNANMEDVLHRLHKEHHRDGLLFAVNSEDWQLMHEIKRYDLNSAMKNGHRANGSILMAKARVIRRCSYWHNDDDDNADHRDNYPRRCSTWFYRLDEDGRYNPIHRIDDYQ